MDTDKNIELQTEMVSELEEVFADFDAVFEDEAQASITILNYAIKTLMHKTDPLITSELVSSSLSAWMAFARHLSEEEMSEIEVATVGYTETEDAELSSELLFMNTEGVKPN